MIETKELKTEDNLKIYFNQVKVYPLLNFEQEIELSKLIQKGNEEAKQKLINSNLRLVIKIAKAYLNSDVTLLDIIQEGNLGLMKAAEKYDYRKNVRFSTYAAWWIKQSIVRSLSKKRRSIRLPHRKEESVKQIQKAYNLLCQQLNRQPTVEEIAEETRLNKKDVISLLGSSGNTVSLDAEINNESNTLQDLYEDNTYCPDKIFMDQDMKEETQKFLNHLLEKEKTILLYRFSLMGNEKSTLKEISEELNISPETVRQIEIKALKKLQKFSDELKEYVYN